MSKVVFYLLFLAFVILAIPAVLSLGIQLVPGSFQHSLDDQQKIYGDKEISQVINVDQDRLSGIGISIRNFNLINKKDIKLTLYKGDAPIRTVTVNGGVIRDGHLIKFLFDPITGSKGQAYRMVFSAEQALPDEALEIFFTKNLRGEPSIVDKEVYEGGLSKVLFYSPSNKMNLIADIYGGWFRKLTADLPFFVFYSLLWILGVGYLVDFPKFYRRIREYLF